MSIPSDPVPPEQVRYNLEEALELLAAMEEARDALVTTDHLAEVSQLEHQIQALNRRLGFGEMGGSNG